eukprot:118963_1
MLGLFNMGRGSRAKGADDEQKNATQKKTVGAIRVQMDINELELPSNVELSIPNPDNLLQFTISLTPDAGYWKGAKYSFDFNVPENYPYKPPKVKCEQRIYHPNIDTDGNICLNLLREDWRPILTVQQILHGLIFLMLEPNPNDPLNHEAAEIFRNNEAQFRRNVNNSLSGRVVDGVQYKRL